MCAVLYDSYIGSSNAFLTHDVALLRNLKCPSVFKDKFPDSSTGISVSSLTWPQPLPSQPGHLCERRGHWLPPLDPTPKPDLMVCPPTDPPRPLFMRGPRETGASAAPCLMLTPSWSLRPLYSSCTERCNSNRAHHELSLLPLSPQDRSDGFCFNRTPIRPCESRANGTVRMR